MPRSVVSAITHTPASGPLALVDHAADVVGVDGDRILGAELRRRQSEEARNAHQRHTRQQSSFDIHAQFLWLLHRTSQGDWLSKPLRVQQSRR